MIDTLPRWAWFVLAAVVALILFPLYIRYFNALVGTCASAWLLETLIPVVG